METVPVESRRLVGLLSSPPNAQAQRAEWTFWSLSAGQSVRGSTWRESRRWDVGVLVRSGVGGRRGEFQISWDAARGRGSGIKSFWPTCGVGLAAFREGSSMCDFQFY